MFAILADKRRAMVGAKFVRCDYLPYTTGRDPKAASNLRKGDATLV
jgi:hypothetical protein